jgi:hypothetical protein
MSKKKKKKKPTLPTPKSAVDFWVSNIVTLLIAITLVYLIYRYVDGYNGLWNNIIKGNLEVIKKYPDLPLEKKWEIKCGFDYAYLNFIKQHTPENACILMPPDSAIYPKGEKSPFQNAAYSIKNKAWSTYFLYPRRLVYESEKGKNPYYDKVDFVAIVNYWGYDKLEYEVANKTRFNVLPVRQKPGTP